MNGGRGSDPGGKHPHFNSALLVFGSCVGIVAAVACGCGGSQTGTVQGRVVFEEGTTSRSGSNTTLQLITARPGSHGGVVATQKVSSTGTYHFTVDPGTYSFSDQTLSPCPGTVTVRSGQTTDHNVICKPVEAVR